MGCHLLSSPSTQDLCIRVEKTEHIYRSFQSPGVLLYILILLSWLSAKVTYIHKHIHTYIDKRKEILELDLRSIYVM